MIEIFFGVLTVLSHFILGQFDGEPDSLTVRGASGSQGFNSHMFGASSNQDVITTKIVTSPNFTGQFPCGYPHGLAVHYGYVKGDQVPIYYLNRTAEELKTKGYTITYDRMFDDILYKFTWSNATDQGVMEFTGHGGHAPVGGRPASRTRAYYMAQLGYDKGDENIKWMCDGILINKKWILTAAHCFVGIKNIPNMLRLGDYDVSVPEEEGLSPYGKFVEDYYFSNVIFHPGYNPDSSWYHDLALIELTRPIPKYSYRINPVCLPWDSNTDKKLKGLHVVLTGWGALKYRGPKHHLLQEVDLKVYNVSLCDESYAKIPQFKKKYPKGLTSDKVVCAGWKEGGKDACGGDSGAPLVYDVLEKDGKSVAEILLVAVVSTGYNCGLKDYPGLYIPVTKPEYLQWIKDTAFQDYL